MAQAPMPDPAVVARVEGELRALIVEALMLEDVRPEDIDPQAPLFGEGLGLDSIDVLELAMALNRSYGVKTKSDDGRNQEIFSSVRSLAAFVAAESPTLRAEQGVS